MIRSVEREVEVVKVDVPFALCIFNEHDYHFFNTWLIRSTGFA